MFKFNQNKLTTGVAIALLGLGNAACSTTAAAPNGFPAALERQQLMQTAKPAEQEAAPATFAETMAQADDLRDRGRISEAAMAYVRALELDPAHAAPRERLAYMQLHSDPLHARQIFEDLLVRDANSSEAYTGLGLAELSDGDLEGARDSLERALSFGSVSPLPHTGLGVIFDRNGDYEAAQEHYRSALELAPGNPELLNNLATSQLLSGNAEDAVESLRQALRQRPHDRTMLNNLGLAYGHLARYEDARRVFQQADPTAVDNNLGYVHFVNGDHATAIAHFENALMSGHGDRERVLQNLHAAQLALYGVAEVPPVVVPEAKPVRVVKRRKVEPFDPTRLLR